MIRGLMPDARKEREFLHIFDRHADEFFSYCVSRIPDPAQAQAIVEETFKHGWDEMSEGKSLRVERLYRLLEESVNTRLNQGSYVLSRFFSSLTRNMTTSS